MTVRHLRAILKKYGGFGVLFVAGYLLLHEGWTRRRGWLLLGVSIAVGLPCGLALLPHRTLPRSPRIASPHLHIVLAPTPQTPRSTWEPVSVQARQRLDEAEKMLHRYVDTPPRADNGNAPDSYEIEGTIQASLDEEASGRGYADLAELHMRVARVDEAVQQWTRAGEMAPDVTSVQTSLAQARLAQQRWKAVEKDLPAKRHLQKLVPFPMRGRNLWVALTCKYCPTDEFYREDARLALYEEHQGQFISLWRSDVIPSIEERGFHPNVWAFPMTGSKRPELVFLGVCSGGSANPTLMQIFRWTGEGFRRELEAQSGEQPLWIEDLRHNGRYQVRCVDYIGSRDGHSDENHVRWPNIYAWNGDQYVLSNAKYPAAFRESRQKLLVCLHDNPEDPELLEYLGKTYLYEHRIREARACFSKMEPACRKSIQAGRSNPDDQIRDWQHLGEVLGVQGRRTEATRCFRQAVSVCRNRAREDPSDQAYYRNMEAHAAEQIRSLLSRR